MHGPAARMRRDGIAGRTVHAQWLQDLAAQRLLPGDAAHRGDQRAEQGVARVGVVVTVTCRVRLRPVAQHVSDPGAQVPRRALPPGSRCLRPQPRAVAQQLKDGHVAHARPGQVLLQRVGQIDQALVAQPQDQDGREGLGDRADPVLRVGVRTMVLDTRTRPAPGRTPLPAHRGHQRRRPPVPLRHGDAVRQSTTGTGKQVFAD